MAERLKAIAAMIGSTLFYLLGDTIVKLASAVVPAAQIIAVRGIITVFFVVAAAAVFGVLRQWSHILNSRVLLRAVFDGMTTMMFVNALIHMPIADATAIINAAPIAATLLAILLLKEHAGVQRIVAAVAGFCGVLLVLRPGSVGFDSYSLLAVGAMIGLAVREVVTDGSAWKCQL